jgi:single-strand DNA-binding protein
MDDHHNPHRETGQAMSGFDINTVTVSGNLTRDPELRTLPSDNSVCNMRIAHNERFKGSDGEWADRAQYFDITVWGGLARYLGQNLAKGEKVVVSGRLKWREYEVDGAKRQAVDITADSVVPVPRNGATQAADEAEGFEPRTGDDDIPF